MKKFKFQGRSDRKSRPGGSKIEVGPGDAYYFAPGHDGWVVGDEPCVMYEIVEAGKDFGPWTHST